MRDNGSTDTSPDEGIRIPPNSNLAVLFVGTDRFLLKVALLGACEAQSNRSGKHEFEDVQNTRAPEHARRRPGMRMATAKQYYGCHGV
jgi:hypothetical protein